MNEEVVQNTTINNGVSMDATIWIPLAEQPSAKHI